MSTPLKNRALALLTNLSAIALFSTSAFAAPPSKARPANPPPQPNEPPALPTEVALRCPAKFIVALTSDAHGNIWVGTEDSGVFKYDPRAGDPKAAWTHFTTKDGLGDNNGYALACDHQGRIWVGHANHGVSVYNGEKWQNYNVVKDSPRDGIKNPDPIPALSGPLGPRVFAIAVSPLDGDVWIGTDSGIARYSPKKDAWSYITRADGLPADQIEAIAFAKTGTVYVATQCDGLAIASSHDNYARWRTVIGAPALPKTPSGQGLPTNLINCLFVDRNDILFVGTTTGLAVSMDFGYTFKYIRGQDYFDKNNGLLLTPPRTAPPKNLGDLLSEDYITGLAEDADDHLWIGYRQKGYQVIDIQTQKTYRSVNDPALKGADGYISAILPAANGDPYIARYGGSISMFVKHQASETAEKIAPPATSPILPSAARIPDLADMAKLANNLKHAEHKESTAVYLGDDWITQGTWLGRYGRYWACLCAIDSPYDYYWGAGEQRIDYEARIGMHCKPGDMIRYWVHWLYTTNPCSLELPPTYMHSRVVKDLTTWNVNRRQAECDDHGEVYSETMDGPHLYCSLKIPAGNYCLSLYFFNKDGHNDRNRSRDYLVSVKEHNPRKRLGDISDFDHLPVLARCRVHEFWNGVWKRFLIHGPTELTIQINRNYSLDTIISGVMLDSLAEHPEPYFRPPPTKPADTQKAPPKTPTMQSLLNETDPQINPAALPMMPYRRILDVPLLRYFTDRAAAQPDPATLASLAHCAYRCGLYDQWESLDKKAGLTPAREIEKALRWDLHTYSFSGEEREVIIKYLAGQNINGTKSWAVEQAKKIQKEEDAENADN